MGLINQQTSLGGSTLHIWLCIYHIYVLYDSGDYFNLKKNNNLMAYGGDLFDQEAWGFLLHTYMGNVWKCVIDGITMRISYDMWYLLVNQVFINYKWAIFHSFLYVYQRLNTHGWAKIHHPHDQELPPQIHVFYRSIPRGFVAWNKAGAKMSVRGTLDFFPLISKHWENPASKHQKCCLTSAER